MWGQRWFHINGIDRTTRVYECVPVRAVFTGPHWLARRQVDKGGNELLGGPLER